MPSWFGTSGLDTRHRTSCHPLHRRKPNTQTSLSPVPHLATEGRETRLYMAGRSFQPKALLPTQGYWEAWWKMRKGSSHSEWPCPRSSFVLSAQESPGLPGKAWQVSRTVRRDLTVTNSMAQAASLPSQAQVSPPLSVLGQPEGLDGRSPPCSSPA